MLTVHLSLKQEVQAGIYGHIYELSFDAGHHSSEGKGKGEQEVAP